MNWDAPPPAILLIALLIESAVLVRANPLLTKRHNSSIEERMLRIEEIKSRIKASFEAMRPPQLSSRVRISEEDRERIRQELRLRQSLKDDDSRESSEDVLSRDLYSLRYLGDVGSHHYKFALEIPPADTAGRRNKIDSATLHLYKEQVRPHNLNDSYNVAANVALHVYQVLANGFRRLISARAVSLAEPGWISLDVTEAVQNWLEEPLANVGLVVDSEPYNLSALVDFSGTGQRGVGVGRKPMLDVRIYQQSWRTRRRRAVREIPGPQETVAAGVREVNGQRQNHGPLANTRRPNSGRHGAGERCAPGQCCKKRLTVSFEEDLGWTWIVEPKTFEAYYCEGGCRGSYVAANNFAEVKKALKHGSPGMQNRCIPTRYKPLTVVHMDASGDYVMTEKRDMIVADCGCA